MMQKLRLLLFSECNRCCAGCCNKYWDLEALPVCKSYAGYDSIMLTGGEPMLNPILVVDTVRRIRLEHDGPIWVYTAKIDNPLSILSVLLKVDGMCVTLHEQRDVSAFYDLLTWVPPATLKVKSMRLNVFAGVTLGHVDLGEWDVKKDMEWIPNCPLPNHETFMRLDSEGLQC